MLGRKKTLTNDRDLDGQAHVGKPATAKGRTLLFVSLALAVLSIAVLTVGVALLQHRVNERRDSPTDLTSGVNTLRDVLQSAHYTPYIGAYHRQWQLLWWIIGAAVFVWLLTAVLVLRAVRIVQWAPALIGLHIYILVLCTYAIDSFLWINHYSGVRAIFGKQGVAVTLAGLFGLAVAEGLAVLAMGLIPSKRHLDNRYMQNSVVTERIVEKHIPVPAPVSAPREMHQESHLPDRQHTPTFTNNPAQPVRVHQGGTQVTNINPSAGTEPVRVHMGDSALRAGATELGSRKY